MDNNKILPTDDYSPDNFSIAEDSIYEKFKKIYRKTVYPLYTWINDKILESKYGIKKELGINKLFLGHRGSDYEALRRKVEKLCGIRNKRLIVIGCGTARDIESWVKYKPESIVGIDYFNYTKAWDIRKKYFSDKYKLDKVSFIQGDVSSMHAIDDHSVDIVSSDAVFEHLNNFEDAVKEINRILKPDGILYATFGPLWYSWGGDHMSGIKGLGYGYHHIRLEKDAYYEHLDSFGEFTHSEHDGRTWIYNNLFSYLKPNEYLEKLKDAGFEQIYASALVDHRTIAFKEKFPEIFAELESKHGFTSLAICGMTIICRKK